MFYIVLALALVLAFVLGALLHAGFFSDLLIRTSTPLSCPKRVAYKLFTGSYKQAGTGLKEVMSLVSTLKTFGVYYDDPKKVKALTAVCVTCHIFQVVEGHPWYT